MSNEVEYRATREENNSMSFDLWRRRLRMHWWVMPLCLLAALIPILVYNQNATPVYRASTKLIFEDGERVMESERHPPLESSNFISNQIEEMKTKAFAAAVYNSLSEGEKHSLLQIHPNSTALSDAEFSTNLIRTNLVVEPTRETEIVEIFFDSPSASMTQTLANKTAGVLIQRNRFIKQQKHGALKETAGSQLEIVREQLLAIEAELRQFKESENITSLESETHEILARLTQAEVLYNQVTSEAKEVQGKLALIKSRLESQKEGLGENLVKTGTPKVARLKDKLVELEIQYSNLQMQGLPSNHPKTLELQSEIATTKENIIAETVRINSDDSIESQIDPLSQIQKYLGERVTLELEAEALHNKGAHLSSVMNDYRAKLRSLPKTEMVLAKLLREREASQQVYMTLLAEREKARIKEASEIGEIRIIEPAKLPLSPVMPRKLTNILFGTFTGLIVGLFWIGGVERWTNTITSENDVYQTIGVPVIASLPRLKKTLPTALNNNGSNGRHNSFKSHADEAILLDEYNLLHFTLAQKIPQPSIVMLTSSIPNEGKSTIATMLALTSAQRGERTLLIDCDLRRPTLDKLFDVPREPGLTNMVAQFDRLVNQNRDRSSDENTLSTLLLESLVPTFEKNLTLLPSGFLPTNPVRAWSSKIWGQVFKKLREVADIIIVDSPPLIGIPDTAILAMYADYILYCVETGGIDKKTLYKSFNSFRNAVKYSDQKIVGVVLNKIDLKTQYSKYKYYRYYSNDSNGNNLLASSRQEYTFENPF